MEEKGSTTGFEFPALRRDGSTVWVSENAHSVHDAEGKLQYYEGTLTDIADRKAAEASLKANVAKLNGIFSTTPMGLGMASNRVFIEVNEFLCRMLGYGRNELVGKETRFLFPTVEEYEAMGSKYRSVTEGNVVSVESRYRCKDGRIIDVAISLALIDPGNPAEGEVFAMMDITSQKKATEERLRMARQIELLLESTGEGIYGLDTEGRCVLFNRAGLESIGFSREEVLGKNIHELIHHHHPDGSVYPEADCCIIRAFRDGEPCTTDNEVFWRKDGTSFPVQFSSHPIKENGDNRGAVVVFSDITEKKTLNEKLMRNQRLESVGMLAGGIAHDLNNVLAPIMMSLELLKMKFADAPSQDILDTIGSSAQRGADLVKQVLTFSRGIQGERTPVQLGHIVREMKSIISQTFPKTIQVRTHLSKELWLVQGDATQLHQVLMNLCVNARDAMPNGGMLTIRGENLLLDEAFARMNPEAKPGSYTVLSVSDTGTGMTAEVAKRIFEPFFTTKGIGQGTGLGLSTVLGIVKSHDGFLDLESEVGRGSCFKIYLPATTESVAMRVNEEKNPLPKGNGEWVLIVDDEEPIRVVGKQALEMCGYQVLVAENGAAAIGLAAQHRTNLKLMITDMMMPIMDGPATITALRHLIPGAKIIASSGMNSEIKESNPAKLGVDGFLRKPFTAETLAKTVHEVLKIVRQEVTR